MLYTNTSGQVFVYKNEKSVFRQIQSLDYYDKIFNGIAVSQDGQTVALAGADGYIRMLDKKGGHFVKTQTLEAGGYALRGVAFSPALRAS